jgi:serine/threonine protein kinase
MKTLPFNLDDLERLLSSLVDPRDLFGKDPSVFLKDVRILCHPDLYRGDPAGLVRAEGLRNRVEELARLISLPQIVIKSPAREYRVARKVAVGDISDVFLAAHENRHYVVKASRVPNVAKMIENEADAIKKILTNVGKLHYDAYFPPIVESFPVRDRFAKRVNVMGFRPGFFTLGEVHRVHPSLEGRHLAWIFKRILTGLGVAHQAGVVHGAVLPPHVMVNPLDHGVQFVGWGQCTQPGSKLATASSSFLDYYPTEARNKEVVTTSLDIYMAAKTMIYLAGGDPSANDVPVGVPRAMHVFLKSCLIEGKTMRPDDAWGLLDEFDKILEDLYGKPKFHVLKM